MKKFNKLITNILASMLIVFAIVEIGYLVKTDETIYLVPAILYMSWGAWLFKEYFKGGE